MSWGVPWPRGAVQRGTSFKLSDARGQSLPIQTWPTAYWPDGTIKWTGHAIGSTVGTAGPLTLSAGDPASPSTPLKFVQSPEFIDVINGATTSRICKKGAFLVDSITMGDRVVARRGKLVCILEDRSDYETNHTIREVEFSSQITSVTLEQSGDVRAVVRIEGNHKANLSDRAWLPFIVRLYFFAGTEAIKIVHKIIFDGDQEKDFIRGLGLGFTVPMREQMQNRHVSFSGEGRGLWAEPIQPLKGRDGRFVASPNDGHDVYHDQLAGQRVPDKEQVNARARNLLDAWALWDDFKLTQPNADGFTIVKRTNPQSCWLPAGAGRRASGLVFAGDASGGLAVGLKNFWESFPASLEVRKASGDAAELMVWLWSPDAPAMDLRHYDVISPKKAGSIRMSSARSSATRWLARRSSGHCRAPNNYSPRCGITTSGSTELVILTGSAAMPFRSSRGSSRLLTRSWR